MKKKSSKHVETEFSSIEKALEQAVSEEISQSHYRRQALVSKFALVLSVIAGLSVLFWIFTQSSEETGIATRLSSLKTEVISGDEDTTETQQIIPEPSYQFTGGKAPFLWTEEGFDSLEPGDQYDATGTRLTKIIEQYGLADQAYSLGEDDWLKRLYLEYRDDSSSRVVSLSFYQNGDDYFLSQKGAWGLLPQEVISLLETYEFKTTYEAEKIVVGLSDMGQGGSSLQEVLEAMGRPDKYDASYQTSYAYYTSSNADQLELVYGQSPHVFYRVTLVRGSFRQYHVSKLAQE